MIEKNEKIIKTEVLIIGGGIAGLQASIAAAENGAEVLILEKADTRRSGSGSTGNDHFMCYISEIHGTDVDLVMREVKQTMEGAGNDWNLMRQMMSRSYEVIQKWESYGINMKPSGQYNFEGHTLPGRQYYHLKYDGHNQKEALNKAARARGVKIMNHMMVNQILTDKDGRAVGAIGLDISNNTPKLCIFQAKAVMIAVANSVRLYPGTNPAYMFNVNECPANAGGAAIAYRAGAKMVNTDLAYIHCGPKFFARSGKATWLGVLSDIEGNPVGPFATKPSRKMGDPMMEMWTSAFQDRMENGTGPSYMNCTELSDEDIEYMRHCFVTEGDTSINDYLDQYEIDLKKEMIEFTTYEYQLSHRGLEIDMAAMTSVPGLFAAGTIVGNLRGHITNAAVVGQIAGESMSKYAKTVEWYDVSNDETIQICVDFYSAILERSEGAHWKEANSTLQQIMNDYAGTKARSESKFKAGLKYLGDLKKYACQQFKAENSHELMRCLEVLDLIDIAEVVILMSQNRKETRRPFHLRTDYIFTNPLLDDKFQTIQKTKDGVKLEFRQQIL